MSRLLMVLLVSGSFAVPAFGVSPDPKDLAIPTEELAKARDLVRKLGSEAYRDREDAHAELLNMGRLARQALVEAASSDPDPEIRFRCSQILPKSVADDLKARLDTYLADSEGKYEHALPGLKSFRKHIGTDKPARELYIEIAKSPYNIELLQAIDRGPADAGRAIADRRTTMLNALNNNNFQGRGTVRLPPGSPLVLADIACLLFAEAITPTKDIPRSGIWNNAAGSTFLQQQPSNNALTKNDTPQAEAYARIVGIWLETRDEPNELTQLVFQGVNGNLLGKFPQHLTLLRRIATTDGVQGFAKGYAISILVQKRGKEEIPFLKTLLKDDLVVSAMVFGAGGGRLPQQNLRQCLVRDVALAMLIVKTDQKMGDYGFKFAPGNDQSTVLGVGNYNYAFMTDEARGMALVKFGFWELKQSLKTAKKPE